MKKKVINGIIIFAAGFVVLFLIRFLYRFAAFPEGQSQAAGLNNYQVNQDFSFNVRNYASYKYTKSGKEGIQTYSVDQKYEKIADLKTHSENIEEAEKEVRELIKTFDSIIQYEQKSGVKRLKNRVVNLAIGVPPEKFDDLVDKLKSIGNIISLNIDKIDKTNEYKKLKAKKDSLLTIRQSLISLKNKGGKIDEYINLENRILEIEKEIQDLGINLGEFDSENEFCTIKFMLLERSYTKLSIPIPQRLFVAFKWTVKYYFAFVIMLFIVSLTTLIIYTIASHLKWVKNIIDKNM